MAPALLDGLPDAPGRVVGDRGFASERFRQNVRDRGAAPAIPAKKTEAPARYPDWIYRHRNRIERTWGRLKEWRAVAPRYEKTARSFMGVLCLAAAQDWLKPAIKHQNSSPNRT